MSKKKKAVFFIYFVVNSILLIYLWHALDYAKNEYDSLSQRCVSEIKDSNTYMKRCVDSLAKLREEKIGKDGTASSSTGTNIQEMHLEPTKSNNPPAGE